jgi:adenylate cyclase
MAQRLRLISGLVLFTYVTTHLLNHALGLVSLQAAEAGRLWFLWLWRQPLGTVLLYGSLLTHLALVLAAVYRRRHFRIPHWEIVRLILGLLIPLFLLRHALGTRGAHEVAGVDDTYTRQVLNYWVTNPALGVEQMTLLVVAWMHGCLGIHYWLRVKSWHRVTIPTLRVLGLIVPLAAIGGFTDMGQEVSRLAIDPTGTVASIMPLPPERAIIISTAQQSAVLGYLTIVASVFAARWVRAVWHRRLGVVRLTYPDGRQVAVTPGTTILEASRAGGIPHASVCGGRGRCSTCRTRVVGATSALPKPSADEARVLRRIGAPPDVRLACQLRPNVDLMVFPLLPVTNVTGRRPQPNVGQGVEREVAILFADLRGFTTFAEHRLPFDVVFVLNQYFAAMGDAVEQAGGYLDKFLGDGVMALFGLHGDPARGCREALRSAVEMAAALGEPLRIGIGLHVGAVIVGEMGSRQNRSLTAIGDAVNTASRLESLTKEYGSQVVLSDEVAERAGVDLRQFPETQVEIRGRTEPLVVRAIPHAADLAPLLDTLHRDGGAMLSSDGRARTWRARD